MGQRHSAYQHIVPEGVPARQGMQRELMLLGWVAVTGCSVGGCSQKRSRAFLSPPCERSRATSAIFKPPLGLLASAREQPLTEQLVTACDPMATPTVTKNHSCSSFGANPAFTLQSTPHIHRRRKFFFAPSKALPNSNSNSSFHVLFALTTTFQELRPYMAARATDGYSGGLCRAESRLAERE